MTGVVCAAVDCRYNNDRNRCTAKKVELSWSSVMTLWEGRQEFFRCKQYEKSAEAVELEKKLSEFME